MTEAQVGAATRENDTLTAKEVNKVSPYDEAVFFLDPHSRAERRSAPSVAPVPCGQGSFCQSKDMETTEISGDG